MNFLPVPQKVKYIEQGQIIKKFNEKTLYSAGDESHFNNLDSMPFRETYTMYSDGLKNGISAQIKKQETLDALSERTIIFEEGMTAKNYFIDITGNEAYESTTNPHDKARKEIKALDKKIASLLKKYFKTVNAQYISKVEAILTDSRALSLIDPILQNLRDDHEGIDPNKMVDLSFNLVEDSGNVELIKIGIGLLGLFDLDNIDGVDQVISTLALYDDFKLFAVVAEHAQGLYHCF